MRFHFKALQGESGGEAMIFMIRSDIDTMYYDRHSEVDFAAILRLPRLR